MNIMVTGGSGFLGTPVVRRFREQGHTVFVPRSREYDLREKAACERALADSCAEIVVHLAARVGGIGANVAAPGEFLYDNAVMGLHLMDAARQAGVQKFVTVGTACEYPENAPVPLLENDLWNGYPAPATAPYGLAKRLILAQAQAYRDQYGFDSIHIIPTNLYGPGDNFDVETGHVIPGLIRKITDAVDAGADSVELWGSGQATREFLYVEDAARAVVLATWTYSSREPLNVGTGVETSIADVAAEIARICGFEGHFVWNPNRPDGTPRRALDVSRAQALGFAATTSLRDGLQRTIEWFRKQERK